MSSARTASRMPARRSIGSIVATDCVARIDVQQVLEIGDGLSRALVPFRGSRVYLRDYLVVVVALFDPKVTLDKVS